MPDRHPNHRRMLAAVSTWIEQASARRDGAALLDAKAEVVEGMMRQLGGRHGAIPAHLEGLTAFDLSEAHGRLLVAANGLRALDAASKVAA